MYVLPDVFFCPVGDWKDTDALAFVDLCIVKFPHLRSLVLRIPGMVFITERKDSLLSTALFFITAAASKGCGKSVFVEGLLESLCLHDISISGSIVKRIDSLSHTVLIDIFQHFDSKFFGRLVTKLDHFPEFPGCVYM